MAADRLPAQDLSNAPMGVAHAARPRAPPASAGGYQPPRLHRVMLDRFTRLPLLAAALLVALVAAAFAPPAVAPFEVDVSASTMTISGTSTMHDWTCEVETMDGILEAELPGDYAAGVPSIHQAVIEIPVEAIECGKGRMNRNLRGALKADDHPRIVFQLTAAEITQAAMTPVEGEEDSWLDVKAAGTLVVAGTMQEVTLDLQGRVLDDGRMRFVGETPLLMTDYQVDPPSFMLGAVKTGDEVMIAFDIVAVPQS